MANKYLDQTGVQYLWGKIKAEDNKTLLAANKYVDDLFELKEDDGELINKLAEVMKVFEQYPEGLDLKTYIDSKVSNTGAGAITGSLQIISGGDVSPQLVVASDLDPVQGLLKQFSITFDVQKNAVVEAPYIKGGTIYENGTTLSNKYQAKGSYQPLNESLTAIGALTTNGGILKRTNGTWGITTDYINSSGGLIDSGSLQIKNNKLIITDGNIQNTAYQFTSEMSDGKSTTYSYYLNAYQISEGGETLRTKYLGKNDNAVSATKATNAENDSNGNKISTTYAKLGGASFEGNISVITATPNFTIAKSSGSAIDMVGNFKVDYYGDKARVAVPRVEATEILLGGVSIEHSALSKTEIDAATA